MNGFALIAQLFGLIISCLIGAIAGSMAAVRPAWHKEPIWSRCIKPLSLPVSQASGFVLGLGVFVAHKFASDYLASQWGRDGLLIRGLIYLGFLVGAFFFARIFVWIIGTLIYGDSVRRAGYR